MHRKNSLCSEIPKQRRAAINKPTTSLKFPIAQSTMFKSTTLALFEILYSRTSNQVHQIEGKLTVSQVNKGFPIITKTNFSPSHAIHVINVIQATLTKPPHKQMEMRK